MGRTLPKFREERVVSTAEKTEVSPTIVRAPETILVDQGNRHQRRAQFRIFHNGRQTCANTPAALPTTRLSKRHGNEHEQYSPPRQGQEGQA